MFVRPLTAYLCLLNQRDGENMFGFGKRTSTPNHVNADIEEYVMRVVVIAVKSYIDHCELNNNEQLVRQAMDQIHDIVADQTKSQEWARVGASTLGAILSDPAFARHIASSAEHVIQHKHIPAAMQRDIRAHCKHIMEGYRR